MNIPILLVTTICRPIGDFLYRALPYADYNLAYVKVEASTQQIPIYRFVKG